ncbi:hypothetical protein HDV02_001931 [Globomyces sp. JEL0801]|nr:hypothetical protein HDV02_001931 [Globomyces sp. JEL0801]
MDGKSYIQMEFNYPVQAINGLRNSINIAHPNSVIYAIGSRAGSSLSKHTTSGNILFSIGSNFTVYSPTPPSPTTTELVHVVTPTPEPLKPLIMSPDGRWTLHHKVSDIKNLLHIVVDAEAEITEWIGFGVSPTGAMDGSSMVIGWFNNDGSANISHYKGLSDQAPIRDTVSEVKSISMSSSNGRVQMEFLYPINSSETVKNPIRYNDKNQFLYAIGQKSGDRLLNHRRKGLLFVDFETGDVWNSLMLKKLHAIFMILGWVLIVPISILLARFGRVKFDSWFRLHQALQFSALILIIGSFIIILYKNKLYISNPHAMLGIIVLSLGAIAVLLGSFSYYTRNPGKTLHWFDDKLHWWVGRTAALLAILNVVIGIKFYTASMISFLVSIVWFIIYIGVWIYLEVKIGEQQSVVIEELDHTTMNLSDSDPSLPISIEDAKPDEGKSKLSKDKVLIIFLIVHIGCVSVMVLSTWTSFDV